MGKHAEQLDVVHQVFEKMVKNRQVKEATLLVEDAAGSAQAACSYGGKQPDSPMVMASTAKLFATTCMLILLEQGKLNLSDRVVRYVPAELLDGVHLYKGQDYSRLLTLEHLLFQTSGLPDYFEEGRNMRKRVVEEDYDLSVYEMAELTRQIKPHFVPGTPGRAHYADLNFDLLGVIIESITQLSLEQAFRQFIFQPLGLTHTYLLTEEHSQVPLIYYKQQKLHRPRAIRSYRASGGCITTARELMTFTKAFFQGQLFARDTFEPLRKYGKLQLNKGPITYGGGHMRIKLGTLVTMFMGEGELLGHTGTTGSFAFYYPHKDLYMTGDMNQLAMPALPIRLMMKLAIRLS